MSQWKHAGNASNVVETKVGTEDMVLLQDSKDSGIVENLKVRLTASHIYSYIGPVLIACNPYKWLNIYDDTYVKKYKFQNRNDAHPHIFMTAEAAYRGMINEEENQCIIISGESGAGKTEASKQIQNYIAAVSGGGDGVDALKETFLRSNPVLEAFGNAKTLRNNNSSRFGKYFELKFDPFGLPKGGVITNYLLEKSRIVSPGEGERGFHIFYQLLTSTYVKKCGLTGNPKDFSYLSTTSCITVDGVNDSIEFEETMNAMRSVGMDNELIDQIFSLVAIVLHLGNIRFVSIQEGDLEGSDIQKSSLSTIKILADLMNMDMTAFVYCLTHREMQTMAAGGKTEIYQVPQNPVQASARRDAVAKAIYERLFDMIVQQINQSMDITTEDTSGDKKDMLSISVLDIYGFEIFQCNGFEQMCINYVNEKLQQIFIELTLRAEQDEYTREGIPWTPIPFFNNRIVCDLLDANKPSGLFLVLDDTCKTMHGSKDAAEIDRKFVETASKVHGSHAHFSQNSKTFTIKHYAGEVVYTLAKFGETNKDSLNKDLILMIQTSAHPVMQQLFNEEIDLNNKKAAPTAAYRIRTQCQALITALMGCSPHYVRCIKSNESKQALTIDTKRVQHQVKYLGLAENIKVRRAGYAFRAEYHRFMDRFSLIDLNRFQNLNGSDKDICKELLKVISNKLPGGVLHKDEAQFGRTMIFIRTPETYYLMEQLREQVINERVKKIQTTWKTYCQRRVFIQLQITISKLFKEQNKMRRKESFMRPYYGDYLTSCSSLSSGVRDESQTKVMQAGVSRIIHFYNKNEQILFADINCFQVIVSNKAPSWKYSQRLLVLTDAAIYLMEYLPTPAMKKAIHSTKAIPDVILRRRISIQEKPQLHMAVLESYSVTTLSDATLALFIKPMNRLNEPYRSPKWPEKNTAKVCSVTGKSFTMFEWKKRCKVTGDIMIDAVCDFEQSLPDTGYYTPDRCGDRSIGLVSTDQAEDVLLHCDKRTEFIALLSAQWKKLNSTRPPLVFTNNLTLRAGVEPTLSKLPATQISFMPMTTSSGQSHHKQQKKDHSHSHYEINETDLIGQLDDHHSCLRFTVAAGVSSDIAERRRIRQEEQKRKTDELRAKDLLVRKQRHETRVQEREHERLLRMKEKKERQRLEKEAKAASSQGTQSAGGRVLRTPQSTPDASVTAKTNTNTSTNTFAAKSDTSFRAEHVMQTVVPLRSAQTEVVLTPVAQAPTPPMMAAVTAPSTPPAPVLNITARAPPPPPPPSVSRPAAPVTPVQLSTTAAPVVVTAAQEAIPVSLTPPSSPPRKDMSTPIPATPTPAAAVPSSCPSFSMPALRASPSIVPTQSGDKVTAASSPIPAGQHMLRPAAARSSPRDPLTAAAASATTTTAADSQKDSPASSVPGRHLLRPVQLRSSPLTREPDAPVPSTEVVTETKKELSATVAVVPVIPPPTRPSAPSVPTSAKPTHLQKDVATPVMPTTVTATVTATAISTASLATPKLFSLPPKQPDINRDESPRDLPIAAAVASLQVTSAKAAYAASNAPPAVPLPVGVAASATAAKSPSLPPATITAPSSSNRSSSSKPSPPKPVVVPKSTPPSRAAVITTAVHPLQKRPPVPVDEDDDNEVADDEWDD